MFAVGPAAASASTRYVSNSGSNTDNDCTAPANPCLTVQDAINQANAGDTIAVAGTHQETVLSRISLTMAQWPGTAPAVLDGSSAAANTSVVWVDGTDATTPPVVTLSDLTIENDPSGNGVLITGGGSLTVEHVTISNNSLSGIRVASASAADVMDSTISNNSSTGLWVDPGNTATVERSTISQNSASGVYDAGTATIVRSTITGNTAFAGAGIRVISGGNLVVADSTLSNNAAQNIGGALGNDGTTTVEQSTISHNSSTGGSAIATLNNNVTLAGDILAKQTTGSDCRAASGLADAGYNLDDDGTCISSTSPGAGSHSGTTADGSSTYGAVLDAYLANALANNGGPTQTVAILNAPSPATPQPNPALAVVPATFTLPAPVGATSAACSLADQRGIAPAFGIDCDIGAYLLQATRTSLATSSATVRSGVSVTYTATVTPAPDGGTVTFADGTGNPATAQCGARPVTRGAATCTVSYPRSGVFSVTAAYAGDGGLNNDGGSASPAIRQFVTAPPTPHLSALSVEPHTFRAATGGNATGAAIGHGTVISYRDTVAAETTLRVYRMLRGVKRGRTCVAAPRGKHARTGKPCTRLVSVGSFVHRDDAGINRLHFTGRLHGHALRPGSYAIKATASLDGRQSNTVGGSFVIAASPRGRRR